MGILLARQLLEVFVLRSVYFSSTFEVKSFDKVVFAFILVLNCFLVKLLVNVDTSFQVWWAPVLLQDIVLHFYLFLQIAFEWAYWDQRKLEWQKDLLFLQKLKEEDYPADERKVRYQVELLAGSMTVNQQQTMALNGSSVEDAKPAQADNDASVSYKPLKEMKLSANLYTISYCVFMKDNKKKFGLKSSDQIDVFYRALFMFII